MSARLRRVDLDPDPLGQLRRWYEEARAAGVPEPEAMTLATVDAGGRPSARMVLMRGLGSEGVDIFTNYGSRKARELDATGRAALVWYWERLGRQVRVEGTVTRLGRAESEAYFLTRPRGSRIAAWASPQSQPLADRAALEARVAEMEERFPGDVPLPPFWGGYRVRVETAEVWQAGEYRLHDRFVYTRDGETGWRVERLGP